MQKLLARQILLVFVLFLVAASRPMFGADGAVAAKSKVRVLLIFGGHEFETNRFWQVFQDNPDITYKAIQHPEAQAWFTAERAREYDVLVFYDMFQTISDQAKTDLVNRLKEGKGLVALHHCLASFQSWDEYKNIIGGRYHLQKWTQNGVEKPGSTYLHDVDFTVHVADPNHSVTLGVKDFPIHDETYGGFEVAPDSHVLLTTDAPTSGQSIGWTKSYGKARVVYLELGHDHQAYENPNYRRLVRQAINWTASHDNH